MNDDFFYKNNIEYLTFQLGTEYFAIQANFSLEVLDDFTLVPVPNTVDLLLGVVNFRGEILSVADMHILFNKQVDKEGGLIIVMELPWQDRHIQVGFVVDKVIGVHAINYASIEKAPESANTYRTEVIKGVFHHNEKFIMLLDEKKIIREEMLH